ncbi:hypothetical protein KY358_01230 [Candidatus Woesearchaeota archaeon]|nr:hypothetical protein [Candidatus Woesearchaeota archaeon]
MIHKKGQVSAQVFIYVIAIILFSFILVYGYNSIREFREKAEQIAYIKFKTDLTSSIKRISTDYGTLKREKLFLGGDYIQVCLVQSYKQEENFDMISLAIVDPLIKDSFMGRVDKNAFLVKKSVSESFDAGTINVSGGYACFPVINGRVSMQFEGRGDHTLISGWS